MKNEITSVSTDNLGLTVELTSDAPPTIEQPDIMKAARILSKAIWGGLDSLAMAVFFWAGYRINF